ncbi:pilus assembly protein [Roseobacter sp. HKCCD9010]|uniref:pilus assembly protein n=1 Tax=unclassified Roseobacter TaxID=196798 RepID=UPI0014913D01|nr:MULTISPECIES: pilus assembly protein [unclassified Roseobacter]MBF9049144.1 pilus assembly protein [Rhodobacterales bacterium HKCCD4356]NNV11144.1 pilus assembly protein [Roseobacter sp. HKCCD7357]NNV15328.1 pilus assembly protein [Roseobacter sp. HKCCD8768]NNV24788.1 pilus assembly protein [Roseobacter sp. HKCCD8192]NNV29044.1 pilus assembly protein [Roseobacter sp. HKCCD9061]
MHLSIPVRSFILDDTGAVTVDWVVLTAALVGLGLAVANVVGAGLETLSRDIQTQLLTDHRYDGFTHPETPGN